MDAGRETGTSLMTNPFVVATSLCRSVLHRLLLLLLLLLLLPGTLVSLCQVNICSRGLNSNKLDLGQILFLGPTVQALSDLFGFGSIFAAPHQVITWF